MNRVLTFVTVALAAISLRAEPFAITNISVGGTNVILRWEPEPDRCILCYSPSVTGAYEYVGSVLDTNAGSVSNGWDMAFYRIRSVTPVVFPDPNFEVVVRDAIEEQAFKYEPTNEVFDIDVKPITYIDASWRDIDHVTGIEWLSSLTAFYCSGNNLTNLDVSANTALEYLHCSYNGLTNLDVSANTALILLYCDDNSLTNLDVSANTALTDLYCYNNNLTNLDVSANTALTWLDCNGNPLVEIIVGDTNNLPATFSYDGTPWIHEPIP